MKTLSPHMVRPSQIIGVLFFGLVLLISIQGKGQTTNPKMDEKERLSLVKSSQNQISRIDTIKKWSYSSEIKSWSKKYAGDLTKFDNGKDVKYELTSSTIISHNTTHFYVSEGKLVGIKSTVLHYNRPAGYDSLTMVKNKDSEFHDISKSRKSITTEYVYDNLILKGVYSEDKVIDEVTTKSSNLDIWKRIQRMLKEESSDQ